LHIHETRIFAVRFKHVRRFKAAGGYFRAGKMRLYATLLKTIEAIELYIERSQERVVKRLRPADGSILTLAFLSLQMDTKGTQELLSKF